MILDYGGKQMSDTKTEEKKSKKSKWLILLLLLIIFFLIGIIFFMRKNNTEEEKPVERNVIVNDDNVEEIASKLIEEERVQPGRYEVMMNTTWNFKDGGSASYDAYVGNVERNTNSVYFDLSLSDTEEVILSSPIIPVGSHLNNISLDKPLEKGTYDCVCTYQLVDDNNKPVSKVSVGVTVNIIG